MINNEYYVYVYIDPRNYEEFYFGKGKGSRKESHLSDNSDNEKSQRIKSITNEGLKPIIIVIARDLSEKEALLVEKTLLWKLGKQLTNVATGHYANKFRPHNSFHEKLTGFDFKNGLYYYNVGEGETRCWEDFVKFGFISAGGNSRFRNAMLSFEIGDVFVAYIKGHGFAGIGKIIQTAKPIREVIIDGEFLLKKDMASNGMSINKDDLENCEYVALVEWIKVINDKSEAHWKPKSDLYTTQLVKASLERQSKTLDFIKEVFEMPNLQELIE
jgi:uncharacterized protein